jgi:Zn-finger protein
MKDFFSIRSKEDAINLVQSFAASVYLMKESLELIHDVEIKAKIGASMMELSKCLNILSKNAHSEIVNELFERAKDNGNNSERSNTAINEPLTKRNPAL